MKQIKIKSYKYPNLYTKVDDDDFERLSRWEWNVNKNKNTFYVYRYDVRLDCHIKIHREIMKTPPEQVVDHINHDGLDNQKNNLRNCTPYENHLNQKRIVGKSKYHGVYLKGYKNKPWGARIYYHKKAIDLGYFKTEIGAALAYDCSARILHGKYATQNIEQEALTKALEYVWENSK